MREKLTVERFHEYKQKLIKLINYRDNAINSNDWKNIKPSFASEINRNFIEDYYALQKEILTYDLSAIPFDAWQDLIILADKNHIADFSDTYANIDISKFRSIGGNAIYKTCNLRNIDLISYIRPEIFDDEVIKNNPHLFLSNTFSTSFKNKFYDENLNISDFKDLTTSQIEELFFKQDEIPFLVYYELIIKVLGFKKMVSLYQLSPKEFENINELLGCIFIKDYVDNFLKPVDFLKDEKNFSGLPHVSEYDKYNEFVEDLRNADVNEIKTICYTFTRKNMFNKEYEYVPINIYPDLFQKENPDLFLEGAPEDLREKYFKRQLDLEDIIKNIEFFDNIIIDYVLGYNTDVFRIRNNIGFGNLQKLLVKYYNFFKWLTDNYLIFRFVNIFSVNANEEYEEAFNKSAELFLDNIRDNYERQQLCSLLNLKHIITYNTWEDLTTYNKTIYLHNYSQRNVIKKLGIKNIKKLNDETKIFSNNFYTIFNSFNNYFTYCESGRLLNCSNLNYDEFIDEFMTCLNYIRIKGYGNISLFNNIYNSISDDLKEKYSYTFLPNEAPEDLKVLFYQGLIEPAIIQKNPHYVAFLMDKKLNEIIDGNFRFELHNYRIRSAFENNLQDNFVLFYAKRFGNEATLNLFLTYGSLLDNTNIIGGLSIDYNDSKEQIDDKIRDFIYQKITNTDASYIHLFQYEELKNAWPDIFLDLSNVNSLTEGEKVKIQNNCYNRSMNPQFIKDYPILINILKNKNLKAYFFRYTEKSIKLVDYIDNEKYLHLCTKYGRYIDTFDFSDEALAKLKECKNLDEIEKVLEKNIYNAIVEGNFDYTPEDAPEFLKLEHPELFLNNDAPDDLDDWFYFSSESSFKLLAINKKEWLPYLKDKNFEPVFLRGKNTNLKSFYLMYFMLFGEDAIKLGIQKYIDVEYMIENYKVALMHEWYDKTGKKFIPDHVVMQNFPIEEADKFLSSLPHWTKLMKIKRYTEEDEYKEAMLKLAYTFGIFDQDKTGFKQLQDILTGIPHELNESEIITISAINGYKYKEDLKKIYNDLRIALNEEGLEISVVDNIIYRLYKQSNEDRYVLTINPEQFPKSMQIFRKCIELLPKNLVLSPQKAHQLFGGFDLKYDKDFKDFLLENMSLLLKDTSNDYTTYIANIQKQFDKIKAINSNRKLTLGLAVSYVRSNSYKNVEPGNEKMAEISAIAGYSQEDFKTLQEIYNYGKTRTFSSIPRIANKTIDFNYEILRLDDPLALAIGTLTDCCQKLHDAAEVCMVHSMTDKNGRIFVIKDNYGNIVAQSWVWRNKDVLCFDNIEIPHKAFKRSGIDKDDFSDRIYDIYKKAAQELIKEDEKVYKELLSKGLITQEHYDGLRLGKVTVGLGYNDIADSLKNNAILDKGDIAKPEQFVPPVYLNHGLYTKDSTTQYILEEREKRKNVDFNTLAVHHDTYIIYDNNNFGYKELDILQNLENSCKRYDKVLNTISIDNDSVSRIGRLHYLQPENTRIIIHPNFAIIYEDNETEIIIADLLYNVGFMYSNTNSILIQIRLALDQISNNKIVDTNHLIDKQEKIIKKALKFKSELDIERGITNGRKN